MATDYDQTRLGYATAAPVQVDSNGVATPLSTPDQLASPSSTIVFVNSGTTQLCEASTRKRAVILQNIGSVPVYVSPTATPGLFAVASTFGQQTIPIGVPIHAGQEITYETSLALYASIRTFSGTPGIVGITI